MMSEEKKPQQGANALARQKGTFAVARNAEERRMQLEERRAILKQRQQEVKAMRKAAAKKDKR